MIASNTGFNILNIFNNEYTDSSTPTNKLFQQNRYSAQTLQKRIKPTEKSLR